MSSADNQYRRDKAKELIDALVTKHSYAVNNEVAHEKQAFFSEYDTYTYDVILLMKTLATLQERQSGELDRKAAGFSSRRIAQKDEAIATVSRKLEANSKEKLITYRRLLESAVRRHCSIT